MPTPPALSIVVTTRCFGDDLLPCLDALIPEIERAPGIELIVAGAGSPPPDWQACFPLATFVVCPSGTPLATIRAAALHQASGASIALLDPACRVSPGWLAVALMAAMARPATGGAVEPGARRVTEWAAFWCEYGHYLPPLLPGPARDLTGNNVVYQCEALRASGALAPEQTTFWKATAHRRLRAAGLPLWTEPALLVRLERTVAFVPFLLRRFHHGRCFASNRARDEGRRGRTLVGAPLLPLLFLTRLYRAVWPKQRYRRELLAATPLLVVLYTVWSCGEWCGALAGPGESCARAY